MNELFSDAEAPFDLASLLDIANLLDPGTKYTEYWALCLLRAVPIVAIRTKNRFRVVENQLVYKIAAQVLEPTDRVFVAVASKAEWASDQAAFKGRCKSLSADVYPQRDATRALVLLMAGHNGRQARLLKMAFRSAQKGQISSLINGARTQKSAARILGVGTSAIDKQINAKPQLGQLDLYGRDEC